MTCRRCHECRGEAHHWIENDAFVDERYPEFVCKHCPMTCYGIERDDGATVPGNIPRTLIVGALPERKVQALELARLYVVAAIEARRARHDPTDPNRIDPTEVTAEDTLRRLLAGERC